MVVPTIMPFSSPVWPLLKPDSSWRMTVDYGNLSQVISILSAVPNVVSLLEQINSLR